MENCLVTKLKETIQNEQLVKMDEILLHCKHTENVDYTNVNSLQLRCKNGNVTLRVVGNGFFARSAAEIETNPLTSDTITPSDGLVTFAMSNGDYDIIISGKENLINIGPAFAYSTPLVQIGRDDIKYLPSLLKINIASQKTDLSSLKGSLWLPIVGRIDAYRSSYSGNIAEDFGACLACTVYSFNDSMAKGTIESFLSALYSNGGNLAITLQFKDTNVTYEGNIVRQNLTGRVGNAMVNPTAEDTARGWQIA